MAIDFLGALGAGSDIDTVSLVDSLVAAERAPKESIINARIEASEAQVSAYGRVLSELGKISDAFTELNDVSDFADYTVNVNGALALDGSPA
jgi:flagellar hook-associated protein 2